MPKSNEEISENIVTDLQTNMVMAMFEQGLVKEAENKLEEFGLAKKEIKKLLKENAKYMEIVKEKNNVKV
tara:strand:+ start:356 stop:565 length:210 start_codon:yes stop_codon:yes gene_type:complete